MANYKVPSQAASGADTWSDNLVGLQFTTDASQMTGGNFAIEAVVPEKDTKEFRTQPFSEFLTLDDVNEETSSTTPDGKKTSNVDKDVRFNKDKDNADRSLYGSLRQRLGVAVSNIITKYPAAVYVDATSPVGISNITAENIIYDDVLKTTEFKVQYSLLYNPLDVVLVQPKSNTLPETDNSMKNFFSSYTKYVIDLSGTTFNIVSYTEPDTQNKITLKVQGNCFNGYTAFTESYLMRPSDAVVENFYDELDDLERVLVNRESNPKFNAGFRIPRDTNGGYTTETVTEYANWPISRDGWNIQIVGVNYDYYVDRLSSLGEEIDIYKSNLVIRFLTSPQLYEFDTEDKKIESIFQIYGQSFDKIKQFIDNIAYMRNVTYDGINNVPDILLKNLSETLGLSTVNLFDERSLQESLYTRHDAHYDGISTGPNLIEAEYEFYRRILVNLAYLYKSKGTRKALEFFLKFIGAPEPIIRIDEYVYKVDNLLPSDNVEDDIREAIQGTKIFNYMSPLTGMTGSTMVVTGYTLTQLTGYTNLSRDQYPVDEETGLPRKIGPFSDMYFQKGAGWYKKTLDHRSPDILDEENSDLTSRVKVIKTKSKPFTYGEEYFDVYRQLPGLDYGYGLTSQIDNIKGQIVDDEVESRMTLNRKNVNVFLSADRAIDYDIYRKSRDLLLTFATLPPQTGVTFAEFLDEILSQIITNSHVIKYENSYVSLAQVYNAYQQSTGFTPYSYISVTEFINRLSPYWVNIIEQFVPATTLWVGGNLIGNGLFNRPKFKYKKPCVPMDYTEILSPDFEAVLYEDLNTYLGGGTVDGDSYVHYFRGLVTFTGVSYDIILKINGNVYSGTTATFMPFSGTGVSLICGYSLFNGGDTIEDMKNGWVDALNDIVNNFNTGQTGQTLSVDYFLDTGGTENARFTIISNDYYGCTGNESFEYYFRPNFGLKEQDCNLQITIPSTGNTGNTNLQLNVSGSALDEDGNCLFYVTSGCTGGILPSQVQISDCSCEIASITSPNMLIFTDAANCEQKLGFFGFTFISGSTYVPMVSYGPTFDYGLKSDSKVYVSTSLIPPATYQDFQAATGVTIFETKVEDVNVGDLILCASIHSCSELTAQEFKDAETNGYQFAFDYTLSGVTGLDCFGTKKYHIINDVTEVLPTTKLLVYTNMNTNLQAIPYQFKWKYPQDLFIRPDDDSQSGDFLINEIGFPTEVTGVTFVCSGHSLYYQVNLSTGITTNILFNGDDKFIVKYENEVVDDLWFNAYMSGITPSVSATPSVTPSITPSTSVPVISDTPSVTPSITPSVTPSITPSTSVPVISDTPSVTPSISVTASPPAPTPSITPTPTPSVLLTEYYYYGDLYNCDGTNCSAYQYTTTFYRSTSISQTNKYYKSGGGVAYIYGNPGSGSEDGDIFSGVGYDTCQDACLFG